MDAVSRYELLQRLLYLHRKYHWAQFTQVSSSASLSTDHLGVNEESPIAPPKRACSTRKARIVINSDDEPVAEEQTREEHAVRVELGDPSQASTSPRRNSSNAGEPFADQERRMSCDRAAATKALHVANPTPSRRRARVILSDSEDEVHPADHKTAHIKLDDSDEESVDKQPPVVRRIRIDSFEVSDRKSDPEDSMGEEDLEDGITLGSDSGAEGSGGEDENMNSYEDDGWLVDDFDVSEEDTECVDLDREDALDGSADSADKENVRWQPTNTIKTHPPLKDKPTKKTTMNESPVRRRKDPTRPAPSVLQTPSRTQRNQHRVEAVSTGKKKTNGYHRALAEDLYQIYNELIFDNQLPTDLSISWNKRLLTTAGYCRCRKQYHPETQEMQRTACIELSNKVVDNEVRLRETLVHEMCHAATWIIDRDDACAHGKLFKAWGRRATKQFPDIGVVSRCHSYEIHAPHKFQCVKEGCGVVYSRHTKKGLNTDSQRCGVCRSELAYRGISNKDGKIAKPRQASAFSAYVKTHFGQMRDELACLREGWEAPPGTQEVMRALAERYKAQKGSGDAAMVKSFSQPEMQDLTDSPQGPALYDALDALQSALIDLTV